MLIYRWWPGAGVFSPAPAPAKKSVSAGSGSTTLATLDSKICQFCSLKKRFINKNLFWIIFGFINSELISCLLQEESFSFLLAPTVQKIGSGADQKWRLRLGNTFTKLKKNFLQKYIFQELLIIVIIKYWDSMLCVLGGTIPVLIQLYQSSELIDFCLQT